MQLINKAKQKLFAFFYLSSDYHLVWMDETNVNLFCRRTRGRARMGQRAVAKIPNSKGPNVHVIGAISINGSELIDIRRGSFKWESANTFMNRLIDRLLAQSVPSNRIAIICDNAPVHARFERVGDERGVKILRLGPYSPMLNPIENIWAEVKACIKRFNRIPVVDGPGVMEQRLVYLEGLINRAVELITPYACITAINHSTTHHRRALAMEDMEVGR